MKENNNSKEDKRGNKKVKIVNENLTVEVSYTLDQLKDMKDKKEIVIGTVQKFKPDECLIIDLGNDILAEMPLKEFEDSENVAISAVISKVGKHIMGYVDNIDSNGRVYLSRAKLQKDYKETSLKELKVGTVFTTTILSLAPFGAFVDMGIGVLGLLPIGDVSIARFSNIRDVFKIGNPITVVYKGKTQNGYVVSHKELLGTWEENLADFKFGEFCQGIIREIKSYGAFIEIAPNLTGLADFPEEFDIHIGDSVCVMLKSANAEKLKVKLQIVSISDAPYKVRYNYKITEGIISKWRYTPKDSVKEIKTDF